MSSLLSRKYHLSVFRLPQHRFNSPSKSKAQSAIPFELPLEFCKRESEIYTAITKSKWDHNFVNNYYRKLTWLLVCGVKYYLNHLRFILTCVKFLKPGNSNKKHIWLFVFFWKVNTNLQNVSYNWRLPVKFWIRSWL